RLDVPADVSDLGELRCLDLQEGRAREPRQAPRDLRLSDPCRPDHQDVLWYDLLGDLARKPLAADAIAHRDGHGPLRALLTDNVPVEVLDDLSRAQAGWVRPGLVGPGCHVEDHQSSSHTIWSFV